MLTENQLSKLHQLQGDDNLLNALCEDLKEFYLKEIGNTDKHETNKREDLFKSYKMCGDFFLVMKSHINKYNTKRA